MAEVTEREQLICGKLTELSEIYKSVKHMSAYSTFTGLIIVLCCWHIEKLKSIQELWLYLIISGGALVYTCVYGILKSIDNK